MSTMETMNQKRRNLIHDITLSDIERCIMSNNRFLWEHSTEIILQLQKPDRLPGRDLLIFRGATQVLDTWGNLKNTSAYKGDLEPIANIELKTTMSPGNIEKQLHEATHEALRYSSWGATGYSDNPKPFKYNIGVVCFVDECESLEFAAISISPRQAVYQVGESPTVKLFNTYYSQVDFCKGLDQLIELIASDQGIDTVLSLANYNGYGLNIDFNKFAQDPRELPHFSLSSQQAAPKPPPQPVKPPAPEPPTKSATPQLLKEVEASRLGKGPKKVFKSLYPLIDQGPRWFEWRELEDELGLLKESIKKNLEKIELCGFVELDFKKKGNRITHVFIQANIRNL